MISQHVSQFIAAVGEFFPPSAKDQEAAERWALAMDHVLREASPDVLAGAARVIIETRDPKKDGRFFPLPSECRAACIIAKQNQVAAAAQQAPLLSHGQRDQSPWAGWRLDRADELISTTEMGRQAAREGWTQALHNYIREKQRLPSAGEIGALKAIPLETDRLIELCDQGLGGACSSSLARLARTIKERSADMAAHVLEGAPKAWRR